jgi:hypothetical protein
MRNLIAILFNHSRTKIKYTYLHGLREPVCHGFSITLKQIL